MTLLKSGLESKTKHGEHYEDLCVGNGYASGAGRLHNTTYKGSIDGVDTQ
ncbi:hypothetical protein Paes_1422 [Prosthecochloris aestuarii DSM 271]|uniref:Uncharacterized protein n=1 Tax=Prosthecochloris aestuarii (strain DSM 271 / SK 413) TaxID=290512 RepID=B4S8Q6_PROA2|nr:hypothetical protein Paes_1422 [Prosthecochloris aestuarii DSM 271]